MNYMNYTTLTVFSVLAFVVQGAFCVKGKKRWVQLVPMLALVFINIVCWAVCFVADAYLRNNLVFIYAAMTGVVTILMLAAACLAWGICWIVKTIQKKRK